MFAQWNKVFPFIPIPLRLPFGAWWLLRNDQISATLIEGSFENAEVRFVEEFLRPGMTVLDIGANQGYYTLLASRKVGSQGKVLAFEPSPREMHRLNLHIRLNHCSNVETCAYALGGNSENGQLHVVLGTETGCNSLRPPDVQQPTNLFPIRIERLDDVLESRGISKVDFIKLDVEGAELSVLHGAQRLLQSVLRPVILAEVQEIRTQPWGYGAAEIIRYLADRGYNWFSLSPDGAVTPLDIRAGSFDGNFVACPLESEFLIGR